MKTTMKRVRQLARETLAAGKRVATSLLPYAPIPGGRELLEQQYSRYVLHAMWSLNELPRFGVVISYCQFFRKGGSILDVGCGEGMLQDRLCKDSYSEYVGVDISQEAISRAMARSSATVSFVREDAAAFTPDRKFDVIIFNECIYYFDDPVAVARRYEQFLNPEGIIIVSMFVGDTARTRKVWKMLDPAYRTRASTRLTTKPGYTWIVKVYSPR
jgi:2-polyprenyl-3-methyl-5-hydroxy-6-metoxy-1,4-benzoquinol methylase